MLKRTWEVVRGILVLHRLETVFFVAPLAAWGPLLAFAAGGGNERLVWLAVILNVGTAYNGFLGNSYCDYELDRAAPEKRSMTTAMNAIGHRAALAIFILEIALLIVLFYQYHSAYAGYYADFWFWLGMLGRYLYNFPPFRFKERGLLNMFTYALNFGVTPFFLAWSIFYDSYPIGFIAVGAAGFLLMASQSLWGAAVDYDSDKRSNAKTVAVALGFRRSLQLSQWLMGLSAPLMVYGIYSILLRQGLSTSELSLGLVVVALGFGYSIMDRVWYVVMADDVLMRARLKQKMRQLAWLVVQMGMGLAGLIVMATGRPV